MGYIRKRYVTPGGISRQVLRIVEGRVIVVRLGLGESAPSLLAASAATELAETTIKAAATGSTEGLTDEEPAIFVG
jgi:hypothetical protein